MALCFLISFVASIAFIACYVIFQVHTVDKTLRSNLGLGLSMTVAFLALGVGATIWVRHLMPHVELTEERKPLASKEEDRAAFAETFEEGAEASQFVKRPLVRRSLLAASTALAIAPLVLLRDLGPLPRTQLRHTAWRKGSRLVILGTNRPIKPADFSSPGAIITVIPEGIGNDLDALAKAAVLIIKFRPGRTAAADRHELDRGRHRRVLQDLHACRLPGGPLRAHDASHPVPMPSVDVRRAARR